jgi:hypothetical protein
VDEKELEKLEKMYKSFFHEFPIKSLSVNLVILSLLLFTIGWFITSPNIIGFAYLSPEVKVSKLTLFLTLIITGLILFALYEIHRKRH